MTKKWEERRYQALLKAFSESEFRFEEAVRVLKEKYEDSEKVVAVFLALLKKSGLLEVRPDPEDARRSIYRLLARKIFPEALFTEKKELTRGELEGLLKSAADLIRTRVDYTFILLLLFYKRLNDKWEMEYQEAYKEALDDGLSEEEAKIEARKSFYHDFDLPEDLLWENIRENPARIVENFNRAMKALAEKNPELQSVFERADFAQFTTSRENAEILRQLVELFSAKSLYDVSPDVLGDAYEWILRYFAPQKAKEGEVYTPREVIQLLVKILDPKPGESVYDPACGSGGMLISSYLHIKKEKGRQEADKLFLFGQEANLKTLALCKMNLYIHDIRNHQISQGDTLLYPKFKKGEKIKKFDIVVANPPWNQDGYGEEVLKKGEFWKERFRFGFTPNQSADWAWVQHMLASAKDEKGRVGVVIDNGCLFRGGKERAIRSLILEKDFLDCVILLPEKLFYNTGAPGAILIFSKNKPEERKGKVLFINASQEYEPHPEERKLNRLGDGHIKGVVEAYKGEKMEEGFAKVVEIGKIKENDYNLNVTLYVFPEEEEEKIDINKEWQELASTEKEIKENEMRIARYLQELAGAEAGENMQGREEILHESGEEAEG